MGSPVRSNSQMTQIPEDTVTIRDLYAWYEKKQALQKLQLEERALRDRVFRHWFPAPVEGVQRYDLAQDDPQSVGFNLTLEYGYDRKIDEQTLEALKTTKVADLADQLKALGMPVETYKPDAFVLDAIGVKPDELIRWKPEPKTK